MTGMKTVCGFCAVAVLAACGGGGGSDVRSFQDLGDEFLGQIEASGVDLDLIDRSLVNDPASLPTVGTYGYDGTIAIVLGGDFPLLGELDLEAAWEDNAVSGSATGFVDPDDTRYSGKLNITNGQIDRTIDPENEFTFEADIGGTLTDGTTPGRVNGELFGDFYGDNQETVFGGGEGTVTFEDGTASFGSIFIAER